jgi:repressor LexA
MIDDGILDGDIVVVQARPEAHEGEVVVALIDGEVTLKRFYRAPGDFVRLQPANAAMQPLIVSSSHVVIQGVVVGLLRRYP